jgi:peptide deformylase
MVLPIIAYGDPVLRKKALPVKKDHPQLAELIQDMFDTMYNASGVGLAAPQVGKSLRLFVIDGKPFEEDEKELGNFKKVFINAQVVDEEGEKWVFNEGCLSIPGIREDISRHEHVHLRYMDEHFKERTETFTGLSARIIQHEYDHIEGILFTDKISSLKKRLIKGKLNDIKSGKVDVEYKMRFTAK